MDNLSNSNLLGIKGLNLDDIEFKDLGVSGRGKNLKQEALGLILKKAESGELPAHTCLVVESMSRLTRDEPMTESVLLEDYGI